MCNCCGELFEVADPYAVLLGLHMQNECAAVSGLFARQA